jgi:molybdopterin/thiamine biosynthesis adenylyltransferase
MSTWATDTLARRHSRSVEAGYSLAALTDGHVVVVGAGALGQNVLLALSLAGVGEITIIDFDTFEDHNITRSPLYPTSGQLADTHQLKALGVALRAVEQSSAARLTMFAYTRPVQQVPITALRRAHVIVSAVDSAEARRWLARTARLVGRPLVEGGFEGSSYNTTSFTGDSDDACLACLLPDSTGGFSCNDLAKMLAGTAIVPALQTTAAVLGGLIAEKAIAALHGSAHYGTVTYGDIRKLTMRTATITRDGGCAVGHDTVTWVEGIVEDLPATWAGIASLAPAGSELLLAAPVVLTAQCPACLQWCHPNATEQRWRGNPYCSECVDGGHQAVGGELAFEVVERVEIDDIAERLTGVEVVVAGAAPGGAVLFNTPDNVVAMVMPGEPQPDAVITKEGLIGGHNS